MLYEIELLITAGSPEVLAVINKVFFFLLTFCICEGQRRFLAKRWIGKHVIHTIAGVCEQRITTGHRYVAINVTYVMQIQVHQAQLEGGYHNFASIKCLIFKKFFLLTIKRIVVRISYIGLRRKEEPTTSTAGVCYCFHRLRTYTGYHSLNQRTRSEILACT